MIESNSVETKNLNDQTKFRLNEINKIKNCFDSEILDQKEINKKLSKCIAAFNYIDKTLIVLSATFGTLSVVSHAKVVGIAVGIPRRFFDCCVFFNCRNNKEFIVNNEKEKRKAQ